MVNPSDRVVWLQDIDKSDAHFVGVKTANLGEMLQNRLPVPEGFAVTTYAFFHFLKENNLDEKIEHLIGTIRFDDAESLSQVSSHVRQLINKAEIPSDIVRSVFSFYSRMEKKYRMAKVAVRSSMVTDDGRQGAYTTQQKTFLNISGESSVIGCIRQVWSEAFAPHALLSRKNNRESLSRPGISIVTQKMVQAETSGILFTVDPATNNRHRIVIEAIYGLGEYMMKGRVTPDQYSLDKEDLKIVSRKIMSQPVMLVFKRGENKRVLISERNRARQKINDETIKKLGSLARKIEEYYYFPQIVEWAIENGQIYAVQTRPLTTFGLKAKQPAVEVKKPEVNPTILIGEGIWPGIAVGKVRKIYALQDVSKIERGDIVVADATYPDFAPGLRKALAIITQHGSRSSHTALIARELGIPAVTNASHALERFKDGQIITVHGGKGEVYAGSIAVRQIPEREKEIKTATQLLINISDPKEARELSSLSTDGVGLLDSEYIHEKIGVHPKKIIEEKRNKEFIEKLSSSLEEVCAAFYPRPVRYRLVNLRTDEYRNLVGGRYFEFFEKNPALGYRGAVRLLENQRMLQLELEAIKLVREKKGYTNLHVMVPFVRTVRELREVKSMISGSGLRRSSLFNVYMVAQIPSNVVLIDKFIDEGIDGVIIDSDNLSMMILGFDYENENISHFYTERDESVLFSFEQIIKSAREHKIPVGIYGEKLSRIPDVVEQLVSWGISSLSVPPSSVHYAQQIIYKAENKIVKGNG